MSKQSSNYPELDLAVRLATDYLDSLGKGEVHTNASPETVRAMLNIPLPDAGRPALDVLKQLNENALPGLLNTADGRFYGWVIGGTTPASIAADFLTSTWDQNAAAYACSPSAAMIEEIVGGWVKNILGLPEQASYAFVTGCQMAHFTALAAARHRVLANTGWDVESKGLFGAPPIRVVVGEHHETLARALRLLGFGMDSLVRLPVNEDGQLEPAVLEAELAKSPDCPTVVSLAAGDLNRGAFDPIGELCDIAHQYRAWVHVDGAFGLWVAASPEFRHLADGIEKADSWATDAHKWLNVPYDSGIAIVADFEAHKAAMHIAAAYKLEYDNVRDQIDWNPEWSRRARSIPLYVALQTLGREGVASIVGNCCHRAKQIFDGLAGLDGVEIVAYPVINQGLVRFLDPGGNHDRRTGEIIEKVNESGEAWFGPTTWNGIRVMRVSVSNHRTTRDHAARAVQLIKAALKD